MYSFAPNAHRGFFERFVLGFVREHRTGANIANSEQVEISDKR
jgi:hypothetical protein